ncbi:MAG: hypothetical protein NTV68_14150 [Methanomicrobiales archaeon]|nr:hypothetical protein [Methanomicrobiales archaeon]
MSEYHMCPATTWKFRVVHPEVPGQPTVEARVLEERTVVGVGKILDCASSRQRLDNSSTGSNG